jgi:DNA-binding MarR family transcriptional regulator
MPSDQLPSGEFLREQFPALDLDAVELTDAILRHGRRLEAARTRALAARQLESWEFDVLVALRATPDRNGLSPSALMSAGGVASATVTNRVDRLAGRGLVTREPDPSDRRGVLVRLTSAGRRKADQALAAVAGADAAQWAALPTRRREQLRAVLAELPAPDVRPTRP